MSSILVLCTFATIAAVAADSPALASLKAALIELDAIYDRSELAAAGVARPAPVSAAVDISGPAGSHLQDRTPPAEPTLRDYEIRRERFLILLYTHAHKLSEEDRRRVERDAEIYVAPISLIGLRPEPAKKPASGCGRLLDFLGKLFGG